MKTLCSKKSCSEMTAICTGIIPKQTLHSVSHQGAIKARCNSGLTWKMTANIPGTDLRLHWLLMSAADMSVRGQLSCTLDVQTWDSQLTGRYINSPIKKGKGRASHMPVKRRIHVRRKSLKPNTHSSILTDEVRR